MTKELEEKIIDYIMQGDMTAINEMLLNNKVTPMLISDIAHTIADKGVIGNQNGLDDLKEKRELYNLMDSYISAKEPKCKKKDDIIINNIEIDALKDKVYKG